MQCFTATAKKDVKAEIIDTVQSELGLRVNQFESGHERSNLHYEVYPVAKDEKFLAILKSLRARYKNSGSVVIYEPVDLLFFGPISSLYEKNNPRNISYMPVVIFFVCLDLESKP